MNNLVFHKRSQTLMEVVVSMFVVTTTLLSVVAIFSSVRTYISATQNKSTALNIAQNVRGQLLNQVRADTWNVNATALFPGIHAFPAGVNVPAGFFGTQYTVANGITNEYRIVFIDINYPDYL